MKPVDRKYYVVDGTRHTEDKPSDVDFSQGRVWYATDYDFEAELFINNLSQQQDAARFPRSKFGRNARYNQTWNLLISYAG